MSRFVQVALAYRTLSLRAALQRLTSETQKEYTTASCLWRFSEHRHNILHPPAKPSHHDALRPHQGKVQQVHRDAVLYPTERLLQRLGRDKQPRLSKEDFLNLYCKVPD